MKIINKAKKLRVAFLFAQFYLASALIGASIGSIQDLDNPSDFFILAGISLLLMKSPMDWFINEIQEIEKLKEDGGE